MPTTPIRLLLADDHPPILDWLTRLLECDPTFEVVGQALRADTAIAETAALRPDLLILDYCLPGLPAAEVVRRVGERSPGTRILVYTGYPSAACLREVRRGHRGVTTSGTLTAASPCSSSPGAHLTGSGHQVGRFWPHPQRALAYAGDALVMGAAP